MTGLAIISKGEDGGQSLVLEETLKCSSAFDGSIPNNRVIVLVARYFKVESNRRPRVRDGERNAEGQDEAVG